MSVLENYYFNEHELEDIQSNCKSVINAVTSVLDEAEVYNGKLSNLGMSFEAAVMQCFDDMQYEKMYCKEVIHLSDIQEYLKTAMLFKTLDTLNSDKTLQTLELSHFGTPNSVVYPNKADESREHLRKALYRYGDDEIVLHNMHEGSYEENLSEENFREIFKNACVERLAMKYHEEEGFDCDDYKSLTDFEKAISERIESGDVRISENVSAVLDNKYAFESIREKIDDVFRTLQKGEKEYGE